MLTFNENRKQNQTRSEPAVLPTGSHQDRLRGKEELYDVKQKNVKTALYSKVQVPKKYFKFELILKT